MFNTHRRATDADLAAVRATAERFCARHNIPAYDNPVYEIGCEIETARIREGGTMPRIERLWQRCFCRALGESYNRDLCIAWGHVGVSI